MAAIVKNPGSAAHEVAAVCVGARAEAVFAARQAQQARVGRRHGDDGVGERRLGGGVAHDAAHLDAGRQLDVAEA